MKCKFQASVESGSTHEFEFVHEFQYYREIESTHEFEGYMDICIGCRVVRKVSHQRF